MTIVLKWIVIEWNKLWRQLWFRTANIRCVDNIEEWTYKVNIKFNSKKYSWVWAYIKSKWVFEAHIFDFDQDIYGCEIEVFLLKKIRDNKKFEILEALKVQISKDVEFAKKDKIKVITFWTFDIFHPGHIHFLNESKFYWDELITIVATDKNVEKIKWKLPKNNEFQRKYLVLKSWIPDVIEIWSNINQLEAFEKYSPNVLCMWYDQVWFIDKLVKNSKYNNIEINRIDSYKPDVYKSSLLSN